MINRLFQKYRGVWHEMRTDIQPEAKWGRSWIMDLEPRGGGIPRWLFPAAGLFLNFLAELLRLLKQYSLKQYTETVH